MRSSKILIAESNESVAIDLRVKLSSEGYAVVAMASDYYNAVEVVQNNPPDLVVIDTQLKGDRDAFDLACALSKKFSIPYIFMLGSYEKKNLDKVRQCCPMGVITKMAKELKSKELAIVVEVALYNYRAYVKQETDLLQKLCFKGVDPLLEKKESHEGQKYSTSPLTPLQRSRIKKRLLDLFEQDKPYLDLDLRIKDVSSVLDTNKTYLSQVINDEFGLNFYNFVNMYRVKEVKLLMKQNKAETISSIAKRAGFKSISSFNSAFKLFAGVSPATYRRNQPDYKGR